MTENPREAATACAVCGQPVEPYGVLRHLFIWEDGGPLCTACARTVAPGQYEMAEALERADHERGWES